ncbi:MAG: glucoamylase family protein [bacterium]
MNWGLLTGLLLCLLQFAPAAFAEGPDHVLLLDDFEKRKWQNLIGGACGSWEKDPFDSSEFCRASFADNVLGCHTTSVLRLQYGLRYGSYNGYFSNLHGFDLRPYSHFTFLVKRSWKAYPERFKIEIKTPKRIAYYRCEFPTNAIEWVRVSIPFTNFTNFGEFDNWKRLKELTIAFEGQFTQPLWGVVYFDDIGFSASEDYYTQQVAAVEEDTKRVKAEMLRISQLPEEDLLETISKKTFDYFWYESSPVTGLTKDRWVRFGAASTGATGFGLTAICIAIERGWITYDEGYRRVMKTLAALRDETDQEHGFFVHWVNSHTGRRDGRSEVSSVDTALLLGGVLTVREYFKEQELKDIADEIYLAVDWPWMMGEDNASGELYMGWAPEHGFKDFIKWDMFAEEMSMYLLGLGSPTYPLPEISWDCFARPVKTYGDQTYIYHDGETMFVYVYSQCWVDFRNIHDGYADYFKNSEAAIRSNYRFCMENADKFKTYREGFWGISASDGPRGYAAFAALYGMHDGTIPPYSLCGALPYAPDLAMPTIRSLIANYGDRACNEYGFISAFNLDYDWFATDTIGIDQGMILLMIENYRSGFVWKTFMKSPYIQEGLKRAGFKTGTKELDVAYLNELQKKREDAGLNTGFKTLAVHHTKGAITLDGDLAEWTDLYVFDNDMDKEYGTILGPDDFGARFNFQWDETNLYLALDVTDDEIIAREPRKEIYRADGMELYLDFITRGRNFIWGDSNNFQIGLAPGCNEGKPGNWSWFQDVDPGDNINMAVAQQPNGYVIEAAIRWDFLNQKPATGMVFGASVAVHDLDTKMQAIDKKLNWCFKKIAGKIGLGEITLHE